MTFTSLTFLFIFLPLTVLASFFISKKSERSRDLFLIVISLIFYTWGDIKHIYVLIFSLLFNYFTGKQIFILKENDKKDKLKIIVGISVFINLLVLAFFKYLAKTMPIGISFYTFSVISCIFDLYNEESSREVDLIDFSLYLLFFPKILSGPIVTFKDFVEQIKGRVIKRDMVRDGSYLFIVGLFKKVLIADQLGQVFSKVQMLDKVSSLTAILGLAFYSLQLYFDFSGYSDMAIGMAQVFGFKIEKNFDYPYLSKGISDFWRRWHISLGRWFKKYLYIPLGGNRVSKKRNILNLAIVWIVTGLWHGSSISFLFWGIYHGLLVIGEKYIFKDLSKKLPGWMCIAITDVLVAFGWVFFFSSGLTEAFSYFGKIFAFGGHGLVDKTGLYFLTSNLVLLAFSIILSGPILSNLHDSWIKKKNKNYLYLSFAIHCLLMVFSLANIVGSSYSSFMYFKF